VKVKKYVVDSMPSALNQIRHELGDNAVILNTKELKRGGLWGFFTKKQIEVIAAVPVSPAVEQQRPKQPETVTQIKKEMAAKRPAAPLHGSEQQEVMKEIQGMKEMLMNMMMSDGSGNRAPQGLDKWVERLKQQEVDQEVIHHLMERLMRKNPAFASASSEEVEMELLDLIESLLAEGMIKEPNIDASVNLVSFVGPTGVGKTTTIAKLAAEQVLHQSRKVGMLTTDTYRIAAVEQLKTYANILNVPVETVFSPDSLKKAIKTLAGCNLIFMDTTGRNYQEEQYVQEIHRYLAEPLIQENILVLSMTAKYSDMKRIVDNFQQVAVDKVIFTKLDETSSYGSALNLVFHYPYPVVYFTTGQNVPDDIMKANPQQLAKLILGVDRT
jgi:flagellar biosynthesis protein FlhF